MRFTQYSRRISEKNSIKHTLVYLTLSTIIFNKNESLGSRYLFLDFKFQFSKKDLITYEHREKNNLKKNQRIFFFIRLNN